MAQKDASPLTVVRGLNGGITLQVEGVPIAFSTMVVQSGEGIPSYVNIIIPLSKVDFLTERDVPLQ